jgi:integrase
MAKALTDIAIANLKPRAKAYLVPDGGARGLYVKVEPTGHRSMLSIYRNAAGVQRKLFYPAGTSLAGARKLHADAMLAVAQGRDPATEKRAAKVAASKTATQQERDCIEAQVAKFLASRHVTGLRLNSRRQLRYCLNNEVLPAWAGRTVHSINRRDNRELLESVAETRPIMANRVHTTLSKFWKQLVVDEVIAVNPLLGLSRPTKHEKRRHRVLLDPEIKAYVKACNVLSEQARACMLLLLYLGQRRSEVAGMLWSELIDGVWTLPPSRTKNARKHVVMLPEQLMAILEALPRIGDYVFGESPLGHFDRIKRELDAVMKPREPWVVHDLRRTCATGLQSLGVRREVTEAVLNHHSGGGRSGVLETYQTFGYEPERRDALQRWADKVDMIVSGETGGKVIKIHR